MVQYFHINYILIRPLLMFDIINGKSFFITYKNKKNLHLKIFFQ